jgi:subtilase family serine protease
VIAPGASILLVRTPVSETEGVTGFPQIVTAEQYVIDHHLGDVISQSFSVAEQTFASYPRLAPLRPAYVDAYHHGVTVLAASGDSGAANVGLDGATYSVPANELIFGDAGPNPLAGGGGTSVFFPRPPYQDGVRDVVGSARGVPDISMSGACDGAVDTYQSFGGQAPGWYPVCGTSEATPLFAGIVALAAQVAGHPLGLINPALYAMSRRHLPGVVPVTSGATTVSVTQHGKLSTVTGFSARPAYSLAAGVGTVNGALFVPELARLAG